MEKCLYNNESLYALDIKKDFQFEEFIRTIGAKNVLICPGCGKPVIFKRGEIRDAHFAHKECSIICDYDTYSKANSKRTPAWREIKERLYKHLSGINSNNKVEKDDKLINKHWTDLTINMNGNKIAIELDDKTISANKLLKLKNEYRDKGIVVDWIVLDRVVHLKQEANVYYIKRAFLNETNKNALIVVDKQSYEFVIYKLDTRKYYYKDSNIKHLFNEHIFIYPFKLQDLSYNEQGLVINGFDELYHGWLMNREKDFRLREFELTERIDTWYADTYIEYINKLASGDEHILDIIAFSLEKHSTSKEFNKLIDIYRDIKGLTKENQQLNYLTEVIEKLLLRSKNEQYIIKDEVNAEISKKI